MNLKIITLIAGLTLSTLSFAQDIKHNQFSCQDKRLKEILISIERNQESYSIFKFDNDQQKILVDQGLNCKFSDDGKQLFLCSKKLTGAIDFVQYYSESEATDSMMDGSTQYTGFYKVSWESDVKKSKERVTSIFGLAQNQCASQ